MARSPLLTRCTLELIDALHLNPVTQTYQLRATLSYLDNILIDERRAKSKAAKDAEDDDDDDDDEEEEKDKGKKVKVETKAVQVSVKPSADLSGGGAFGKGAGSGGGNGRADASLFDPLRAKEGEAWINLKHFPLDVSCSSPPLSLLSSSSHSE